MPMFTPAVTHILFRHQLEAPATQQSGASAAELQAVFEQIDQVSTGLWLCVRQRRHPAHTSAASTCPLFLLM